MWFIEWADAPGCDAFEKSARVWESIGRILQR
jgi:hypothetical protein